MTPNKRLRGGISNLIWAVGLNALFLVLALILMPPAFEANDDLTLAAFADGQMSVKCTYIPYINYVLALMLNGLYRVLGEGVTWHTVGQYALLFASFTAVSYVLFRRLRKWQAALISLVMLLFYGVDCYMIISYTKTAGVCAVGGMALLFFSREDVGKNERLACTAVGIALCLFGFGLRMMEFLPCMAIMAVLGLRWLYSLLFNGKELSTKEKLCSFWRYVRPFLLMLALAGVLFAVDKAAWSRGRWAEYSRFDAVRVAYSDYGRPEYKDMSEEYDALGVSETSVRLLYEGNYFDPDVFDAELMSAISEARESHFPPPSLGECLGKFLDECIPGFFTELHVYAFLLIAVLWLCAGEHDLRGWLTLAGVCGLFGLFYLYLIYRGRYLVDRVDVSLFFAVFAALSWTIRPERLEKEKTLSALVLIAALFFSFYLNRYSFRSAERPDLSSEREAVDMLLSDTGHIYLAKLDTVNDTLYPPFTPAPAGYWDRIVLLGGWDCNHPAIMDILSRYGISNPYRDLVGNEHAYIIEDNIDLTLAHIHEFYDADASAEQVQPLSDLTGLEIYRILD